MHSQKTKEKILKILHSATPPSVAEIAKAEGVGKSTINTWLREDKSEPSNPITKCQWTSQEKFRTVMETFPLNEAELAEYALKRGLYVAEIKEWIKNCRAANDEPEKRSPSEKDAIKQSREREKKLEERVKKQEKELNRKEKALAETAALLVLSKKAKAIWGESEDE